MVKMRGEHKFRFSAFFKKCISASTISRWTPETMTPKPLPIALLFFLLSIPISQSHFLLFGGNTENPTPLQKKHKCPSAVQAGVGLTWSTDGECSLFLFGFSCASGSKDLGDVYSVKPPHVMVCHGKRIFFTLTGPKVAYQRCVKFFIFHEISGKFPEMKNVIFFHGMHNAGTDLSTIFIVMFIVDVQEWIFFVFRPSPNSLFFSLHYSCGTSPSFVFFNKFSHVVETALTWPGRNHGFDTHPRQFCQHNNIPPPPKWPPLKCRKAGSRSLLFVGFD